MERKTAIAKLTKLLGKRLGYRVNTDAPDADERAEAKQRLPALTAASQEAERAMNERRQALLAGDAQYQELRAAWIAARKLQSDTSALVHRHRFTVGIVNDLFFLVKAEGDTWEEVIAKVQAKA
jgi:predicted component of type VI protein secretion system